MANMPYVGTSHLHRRQLLRLGSVAVVTSAGGALLAACGAPSSKGPTSVSTTVPSSSVAPTSSASATLSGSLAAPAKTGAGLPPGNAAGLISTAGQGVTIIGDGGDIEGGTDNLVFAGTACRSNTTTLVCKVSSFANLNSPYLYPWARVGLMARGDLSSVAPMVAVGITAGYGIEVLYRTSAAATGFGHYGTGANTYTNVKVTTVAGIPTTATTGTGNILNKPVWLKLERNGTLWAPSFSLDGTTYTAIPNAPAGTGVDIQMDGCWVGAFANAVNVVFVNKKTLLGPLKGQIQVTFDAVNFPVDTTAQIGSAQGLAAVSSSTSSSA